jgi:hypothetical protein
MVFFSESSYPTLAPPKYFLSAAAGDCSDRAPATIPRCSSILNCGSAVGETLGA